MSSEKWQNILTQKEVRTVLVKDLGREDFILKNFSVNPASNNLSGFLGEHYKVKATVEIANAKTELNYFVKKIPTEVSQHLDYALETRAFFKEIELYETLFVDLRKAQSNLKNPTKWCPKCFYSRNYDLFVLEDLSDSGYYMYPERQLMDEEHIRAGLRALAAMHAASLVFEKKFKEGKVSTLSPEKGTPPGRSLRMGELYAHLTFETEASDVVGHPGNTYHEAGIKSQSFVANLLPNYSVEEKSIIQKELPNVLRRLFQLVKTSQRFRNVFVHGDLWANNLLFRKDEAGKIKDAIIVDFQLVRYAPPAHDVLMFLHLVQSKRFLDCRRSELLRYYFDSLTEELEKNSLHSEEILPWTTFLESCDFYEDLGLICKLFYFQFILAPPEIAERFLSTPESFSQVMLTDRSEMVVECFLKDEIFRTRFTEAITDVVAKFILHK